MVISIVTGTAPKESVQKFTNSSIKIGFKKFVWNIPIKSLVYGRSLSPDIYKKYYTHMLKMAPFLTHIFMESWPCFFEIRVPTNGNICQSHFSNVNEMDGAAIHCGQKDFIWKNKMYSKKHPESKNRPSKCSFRASPAKWKTFVCIQICLQWNIDDCTQDISENLSLSDICQGIFAAFY